MCRSQGRVVSRDDRVARVPEAEASEFEEWLRAEENRSKKTADFEFGDRWVLAPVIEDGEFEPLADYLERGGPVTPDIRAFLARDLRRKVKRREGKPRQAAILRRDLVIAAVAFNWEQRGEKNTFRKPWTS